MLLAKQILTVFFPAYLPERINGKLSQVNLRLRSSYNPHPHPHLHQKEQFMIICNNYAVKYYIIF